MTAAVVAPVASNPLSKMPNLSSLRRKGASLLHSPNPSPGSLMTTAAVPQKKRKVSTDGSEPVSTSRKAGDSSPRKAPKAAKTTTLSTSAVAAKPPGKTGGKKPQNKYDPEVPMTKEELVVWRREQRRKRNRESAAASRQKQRDRISELEIEVAQWKAKFGAVMDRLALLEKQQRTGGAVVPLEAPAAPLLRIDSTRTTNGITQGNPRPTPVAGQGSPGSGTNKHHLIETISRPA